jgi:drug/metabolite transporter (DMT)-like permease
VLGYLILGETLTMGQMMGGLLIILGAIGISFDISDRKKIKFKQEVFWLMMLSSLLLSLNFLFFKYFAIQSDFWFTSFWEYVGFAIFAVLLMVFVKSYRNEFINVLKNNRLTVLSLNGVNEIINIIAKVAFNVASLLTPVTLVWIVNGLQPFFVFVYGVLLTVLLPKISRENITRKALLQKIVAIIVMFIGTYFVR